MTQTASSALNAIELIATQIIEDTTGFAKGLAKHITIADDGVVTLTADARNTIILLGNSIPDPQLAAILEQLQAHDALTQVFALKLSEHILANRSPNLGAAFAMAQAAAIDKCFTPIEGLTVERGGEDVEIGLETSRIRESPPVPVILAGLLRQNAR